MAKGPKPLPPEVRLWAKVNKDGPVSEHRPDLGPCWLWTGKLDGQGYGRLTIGSLTDGTRGGYVRVHRLAYESSVGPIPEGLVLDHLCRVRHCVRPLHLEAVTHAENVRRGVRGVLLGTHCPQGHEYTVKPDGRRHCQPCVRANYRRWYYRHRDAG